MRTAWGLSAAFALLACAFPAAAGEPPDADRDAAVAGNNAFACDLYARLKGSEGDLFFSPFSISTALAMTFAGAKGKTAEEMAKVLRFTLPPERLHPAMGKLVARQEGPAMEKRWDEDPDAGRKTYELVSANSLWLQKGYPFQAAFFEATEKHYGAGKNEVDFAKATEAARKAINGWVEQKTRDRIKDLIGEGRLSSATRLVLVNAIYFKSPWDEAFWKQATRPAPFRLASGEEVQVPTMFRTDHYPAMETETFRALALPYARGELSMLVLVPKAADGLPALEGLLGAEALEGWVKALETRRLKVGLPKFRTECAFELSPELQAMGMKDAFDYPAADFTGISPTKELFIGLVIHKAFVDVNEEGTEAAAATAIAMKAGGPPPREPPAFVVDRPFLFLIRDNKTGSILFLGRITDPR
ncbi:MAG: serpin family protein [Planctomycetes bacterium]|jgi:serpin B|nr:serpin family protein [Planctomycetota bacterium]